MAKQTEITNKIRLAQAQGCEFGICPTILSELFYAIYNSRKRQQNFARLQELQDSVILWPFDKAVAEEVGIIRFEQKSKGRPIPYPDMQIAAVCRVNNFTLLTADRHFSFVENLKQENWLT
ncbi:MAG: type II toxin-antitoxin system VapC family toxin [Chloroflexota bacterium]